MLEIDRMPAAVAVDDSHRAVSAPSDRVVLYNVADKLRWVSDATFVFARTTPD